MLVCCSVGETGKNGDKVSFSAPTLPRPPPSTPHISGLLLQPPAPNLLALLLHSTNRPHFSHSEPWESCLCPGLSPRRCSQPMCSFPAVFAGLCPLAQAMVTSELLLPAAHTLPPLLLCSELASPRDVSSTSPQPPPSLLPAS